MTIYETCKIGRMGTHIYKQTFDNFEDAKQNAIKRATMQTAIYFIFKDNELFATVYYDGTIEYKHVPKYAVVVESDFNDDISDMFEIESVDGRYDFKETVKYGIHRARYYMYKYEIPTTLYVFELGKYKETKRAIFSATCFGPIYW